MSASHLFAVSAFIMLMLGLGHLVLTFFTHQLHPRDSQLQQAMRAAFPVITKQSTVWLGLVGFNASHSVGFIMFGAIYGYLAVCHIEFLVQSYFLMNIGMAALLSYLLLAKIYWFKVPLLGIAAAFGFYTAGLIAVYA